MCHFKPIFVYKTTKKDSIANAILPFDFIISDQLTCRVFILLKVFNTGFKELLILVTGNIDSNVVADSFTVAHLT